MLILEQTVRAEHRLYSVRARMRHRVEARGHRVRFGALSADVEIETERADVYRAIAARLRERAARRGLRLAMKPRGGVVAITDTLRDVHIVSATKPGAALVAQTSQPSVLTTSNQVKPLYCQDGGADVKVSAPPCHSPGAILPDAPGAAEPAAAGLAADATHAETQGWLAGQRFPHHAATFANFCGADLLRLSRDDLIQICGLADGIRLFNALHAKRIEPRLTVYVCAGGAAGGGGGVYSAVYLHSCTAAELFAKLHQLLPANTMDGGRCESVLVSGPGGARVFLTDELVRHLPDNSMYRLQRHDATLLLTAAQH